MREGPVMIEVDESLADQLRERSEDKALALALGGGIAC